MIAGLPERRMSSRIRRRLRRDTKASSGVGRRWWQALRPRLDLLLLYRGAEGTRHLRLHPRRTLAAVAVLGGLLVLAAGLGFGSASLLAKGPAAEREASLQAELAARHQALAGARGEIEMLLARVEGLEEGLAELDALAARLADMAGLGDVAPGFQATGLRLDLRGGGPSAAGRLGAGLDGLQHELEDRRAQLGLLAALVAERSFAAEGEPRGLPVMGARISSGFGLRRDPLTGQHRQHRGLDLAASANSRITAVASGVVTWAGRRGGYGRMVEIVHGNGYMTRYAHNARNLVTVGDRVRRGDAIALVGDSGRATGPHVHFEVWQDGSPVDPLAFIRHERS